MSRRQRGAAGDVPFTRFRKSAATRARPDPDDRIVAQAIVNLAAERTIAFVAERSRAATATGRSFVAIGIVSSATAGRAKHSSAATSTRAF